jgi:hypothetical protein
LRYRFGFLIRNGSLNRALAPKALLNNIPESIAEPTLALPSMLQTN